MEVTVNIPFNDLLALVRQLSPAQRSKLQTQLATQPKAVSSKSRLKKLLLTGPPLKDKQLRTIQQTRKEINQWRTKS